jgi:UTP--glucose-1-phosphate uridylyltransferase
MLGDDIIDAPVPCMKQMVEVFERVGDPVIAAYRVPPEEISAYGVIDGVPEEGNDRLYRVRDMVEKPPADRAPSDLAIIGRYILTPDIFEALAATERDAGGEIQLTNGLRALRKHRRVYGYRFDGVRHDAGNKLGFLKATVEFALKRDDLGGPFREYLRSLRL